jgi:hypothetical protein
MLGRFGSQPAVKRGNFRHIPVFGRTDKIVGANVPRDLLAGDGESAKADIVRNQAPPCECQPAAGFGGSHDSSGIVDADAQ